MIDITGHRQTQSYLNEIAWHLRRGPYLAVQPVNHAGEERAAREGRTDSIRSWSWEGCEGRVAIVEVYADADRVDLLLDGVKLGTEPAGAVRGYLSTFSVPYRPGELTAVAYDAGGARGRAGHSHERRSRAPAPGRARVRCASWLTAPTWPISRSC